MLPKNSHIPPVFCNYCSWRLKSWYMCLIRVAISNDTFYCYSVFQFLPVHFLSLIFYVFCSTWWQLDVCVPDWLSSASLSLLAIFSPPWTGHAFELLVPLFEFSLLLISKFVSKWGYPFFLFCFKPAPASVFFVIFFLQASVPYWSERWVSWNMWRHYFLPERFFFQILCFEREQGHSLGMAPTL